MYSGGTSYLCKVYVKSPVVTGILCHAELQVAINPTYSNLFIYLDSMISITIIFVDVSENRG